MKNKARTHQRKREKEVWMSFVDESGDDEYLTFVTNDLVDKLSALQLGKFIKTRRAFNMLKHRKGGLA